MIPHMMRPGDFKRHGEESYIYDNWIRSLADELDIPDDDAKRAAFWRSQKKAIAGLLRRSRVVVACAAKDPDAILGYAIAEPPARVHFVYVRQGHRKGGLCKALMAAAGMGRVATATQFTSWGFPRVARCFERLDLEPLMEDAA